MRASFFRWVSRRVNPRGTSPQNILIQFWSPIVTQSIDLNFQFSRSHGPERFGLKQHPPGTQLSVLNNTGRKRPDCRPGSGQRRCSGKKKKELSKAEGVEPVRAKSARRRGASTCVEKRRIDAETLAPAPDRPAGSLASATALSG